jgi:hypothetical protein
MAGRWPLSAEWIRVGLSATVLSVLTIVLVLTWMWWHSGGRDSGREMFFRYVLTVLLMLIVQIGSLSVTFLLLLSRQSTGFERERMRPSHTIESRH